MRKTNTTDEYRSGQQQQSPLLDTNKQVYDYQQQPPPPQQDGFSSALSKVEHSETTAHMTKNIPNNINSTNTINSNQGQIPNYGKPPYGRPPPIHIHQQSQSVHNQQTYFSGTQATGSSVLSLQPPPAPPPYDDQGRINPYPIYSQQQLDMNQQQQQQPYPYQLPVSTYQPLPPPSTNQSQQDPLQSQTQWQNPVNSNIHFSLNVDVNQYPDITSMVNSNANVPIPLVETQFVDHRTCTVCGKRITRDMSRHMRTHQSESRFRCKFPRSQCIHKSGKFNRPYDYKKHLLNRHFKFDDESIKRLHNLNEKLDHWGVCPCGLRFVAKDWLDNHILTEETDKICPFIEQQPT